VPVWRDWKLGQIARIGAETDRLADSRPGY